MADASTIIAQQEDYVTNTMNLVTTQLAGMQSINIATPLVTPLPFALPGYSYNAVTTTNALLTTLFPTVLTVNDVVTSGSPTFTALPIGDVPDISIRDFTTSAPNVVIPAKPDSNLPNAPVAPEITDISLPSMPGLSMPVAPNITAVAFPTMPNIDGNIGLPDAPSISMSVVLPNAPSVSTSVVLPALPSISAIDIPGVPGIDIPSFTSVLPVANLVVPTNSFAFFEELYTSSALDALKSKLFSDLQNGGYGIEIADESALWARARERELEGALSEAEALITAAAGRGCALPPGDMIVVLQKSQQDVQNKLSSVSRDIALKRADMYVENRKFTIEQTKQLEQIIIGYHSNVMERSLNAAKAVMDVAIKLYDAQVAGFNVRLEAYKAEASVFEARVRAAMILIEIYRATMEGKRIQSEIERLKVEIYKAELEGVKTLIDVDRNRVELYRAQLQGALATLEVQKNQVEVYKVQLEGVSAKVGIEKNKIDLYRASMEGTRVNVEVQKAQVDVYNAQFNGLNAVVNLYKTQMEGATVQVGVNRARIDAFRGLIEAYSSQVQAKVAEFNLFDAQIKGEVAKVQGYEAEANGYKANVEAVKARSDVQIARVRAQIDKAQQGVQAFNAQAEMYRTNITTQAQVISSKAQVYGAQVTGAGAKVHAIAEAISLDRTEKNLEFQRNAANAKLAIDFADATLRGLIASVNARVGVNESAAKIYATLVGAALSSVNALASDIKQE